MNIGARLTKFREAKGLSKNRLAKEVGVTQGFISQLELGNRTPTLEVLNRICSVLGITLHDFFAPDDQAEDMPPDLRRLIDKAKKLSPRQLQILNAVLDEWKEPDNPKEG